MKLTVEVVSTTKPNHSRDRRPVNTLISRLKKEPGRGAVLLWAGMVSLVLSLATLGQDIPDSASSQLPRQPEPFSIDKPLGMPRNSYLDLNSPAIVKPARESHVNTD